jgi:hypothetical protein
MNRHMESKQNSDEPNDNKGLPPYDNRGLPPFVKNWKQFYVVVVLWLVVLIILFNWFTKAFA